MAMVFLWQASAISSAVSLRMAASTSSTWAMWHGSQRSRTVDPGAKRSFLHTGKVVRTCLCDAWAGLMLHHGPSVSSISRSSGIRAATARFSSDLSELDGAVSDRRPGEKGHPVAPAVDAERETQLEQLLGLAPRARERVHDAADEAPAVAAHGVGKVRARVAVVQEHGQARALGERKLRLKAAQLHVARAKVQPVVVQAALADGHDLARVRAHERLERLDVPGRGRRAGRPLPHAALQLLAARRVAAGGRDEARCGARVVQRRPRSNSGRTVRGAESQRLAHLVQAAGGHDDAVQPCCPRALEHGGVVIC